MILSPRTGTGGLALVGLVTRGFTEAGDTQPRWIGSVFRAVVANRHVDGENENS